MSVLSMPPDVLDAILPMHVLFDATGRVIRTGPTFAKIAPEAPQAQLSDVVRVLHPKLGSDPARLLDHAGRRLTVQLRKEHSVDDQRDRTRMRAVVYRLDEGTGLLNVFFGADVAGGILRHSLSARDFAAFDPTSEILFLMEAQAAVLAEFKRLSVRLSEARSLAEEEAVTDKLTGLFNRRAMDAHLVRLADGSGAFGLMHLDLDYFKSVNDTFGHAAGDFVLSRVGTILRDLVRKGDMVARVGGDEFMLVFADCDDVDLMKRIADRVIARLEEPIVWEGNDLRISGSIGITMSSFYDVLEPDRMMSDADVALYASKHEGRARSSVAQANPP